MLGAAALGGLAGGTGRAQEAAMAVDGYPVDGYPVDGGELVIPSVAHASFVMTSPAW